MVAIALGPLPPVELLAAAVTGDAAEGGAVQDPLQDLVGAPRPSALKPEGVRRTSHIHLDFLDLLVS